MNKIFHRFRGKLMAEALCKSLLLGVLVGASAELAFLVVMHLISRDPGFLWIGCVFAVPFLLTFAIFFGFVYYPTERRIARRVDGTGLKDRAGTMLEFKDQSSTIIDMQRADAVQRINDTGLKQIPFRIAPKIALACLIVTALSVGSMFVPYDIMSIFRAEAYSMDEAEAALIEDLLASLRRETADADVADSIKKQLYSVFDELEDGLNEAAGELDKAAEISEAEEGIKKVLEPELSRIAIGAALRQFDSTSALGQFIEYSYIEGVSQALDSMKTETLDLKLSKQAEILKIISSDIEKALSDSGVADTDPLYTALNNFAANLASLAENASAKQNISSGLHSAVKKADAEISAALGEQKPTDDLLKTLEELLAGAKEDILMGNYLAWESEYGFQESPGGETTDGEQDPEESGEPGETESPDGEEDSEQEEDREQSGEAGEATETSTTSGEPSDSVAPSMREEIYDPALGNVPYGQVFAAYYAEYLAAVNEGALPEEVLGMLEMYFESLNN